MPKKDKIATEKYKKKESLLEEVDEEVTEPLVELDGKEEFPITPITKEEI